MKFEKEGEFHPKDSWKRKGIVISQE